MTLNPAAAEIRQHADRYEHTMLTLAFCCSSDHYRWQLLLGLGILETYRCRGVIGVRFSADGP